MNIPIIPNNHYIRESDITRDVAPKKLALVPLQRDTASIGEEVRTISKLITKLRKIQDAVKPDLETLKERIQNGTYDASPEKIARAILFGSSKSE